MAMIIPEIKTTMEEDLRALGLGDLLSEDVQEEACICDPKEKVKKALGKFKESLDRAPDKLEVIDQEGKKVFVEAALAKFKAKR